jgi:hypothetical protein
MTLVTTAGRSQRVILASYHPRRRRTGETVMGGGWAYSVTGPRWPTERGHQGQAVGESQRPRWTQHVRLSPRQHRKRALTCQDIGDRRAITGQQSCIMLPLLQSPFRPRQQERRMILDAGCRGLGCLPLMCYPTRDVRTCTVPRLSSDEAASSLREAIHPNEVRFLPPSPGWHPRLDAISWREAAIAARAWPSSPFLPPTRFAARLCHRISLSGS